MEVEQQHTLAIITQTQDRPQAQEVVLTTERETLSGAKAKQTTRDGTLETAHPEEVETSAVTNYQLIN